MSKSKTNLTNKNILLGVSGGIAAYKAVDLSSKLTAAEAQIKTVMTENACQLVTPKSFEAVTNSVVFTSMWSDASQYNIRHVNLVDWADVVIVAPATANIIGKIANGICDDLLSTILCVCWNKKVLLAPAMNNNMWQNPAVKNNVDKIKEIGFELIGPVEGRLACGTIGPGRMAEPDDIIKAVEQLLSNTS
jgi:phosphopantothenoylcysteine decarboxylase/phosphopantothenate--cysteine ligase